MSETDTYRALYVAESREYLEAIVKNLLLLEKGTDHGPIDEIFRAAHSLKGMSASMGFSGMERLCHAMEDVFSIVRNGKAEFNQSLGDLLLAVTDEIESMLDAIEAGEDGNLPDLESKISALSEWREDSSGGKLTGASKSTSDQAAPVDNAVEGDADYLIKIGMDPLCDSRNLRGMLLLQNLGSIGEIVSCSPPESVIEDGVFDGAIELGLRTDAGEEAVRAASQVTGVKNLEIIRHDRSEEPVRTSLAELNRNGEPEIKEGLVPEGKGREVRNIRVDIARLDQMMNLVEDLVINRGRIQQIARKNQLKELEETLNMVGRSVSDLQNLMMNIRMIPLTHIFNRFPRVVRDIARREEKEVELLIEGGDVELDRSVMEGLNDPLLHLIRNAIDHGIELPAERTAAGKPETGHLRIAARRESENVIILIEDDGKGIDPRRVRAKAIERGVVTEESAGTLSDEGVYDLLFLPGFSTAEKVTDISGRGVGLDVVRTAVDALKGSIRVESAPGKGTSFELLLPPTMAIVNVIMVRINGRRCAIPVNNVVEVASLASVRTYRIGTHETVMLREEVLPLDRLDDMFGNAGHAEILVVLQHQNRKRSIVVDMIEGQQEVVIKPLGHLIGSCRGISGVTIPGDGEVVPVLDVNTIVKEI